MIRKSFIIIILFSSISNLCAVRNYTFNNGCRIAYTAIYTLKIDEADRLIALEKNRDPDNMIIPYLEGSSLFMSAFVSNDYKTFQKNKAIIENKIDQLKSSETNNEYYYFCKGELYFQLSMLSAAFGNTYEAIKYGKNANNQYTKCLNNYPAFPPAKMGKGYINTILGQIPDSYKWAVELIGITANSDVGIRELDAAYSYSTLKDTIWRKQNTLLISSLYSIYERTGRSIKGDYIKYISWLEGRTDPLSIFILSTRLNKMGQTDRAIELISLCNDHYPYKDIAALDMLLGTMKLQRLDKDAINPLLKFHQKCNKGVAGCNEVTQKIAWYHLLNGNHEKYNQRISNSKSEPITQLALLKARLLFDGGYIKRSKDTLKTLNHIPLTKTEQAEYYYRMGRINEKQNQKESAIANYNHAINTGVSTRYTASAALKLGDIHSNKGELNKAKAIYSQALKMKFTEYYDEITSEVKQKLNSINRNR